MERPLSSDENGLKKGPWTPEEDEKLRSYIQKHGRGCWRALPHLAGLNRCGKSCRLRWMNYLRPDIRRGDFSQEEEQTILQLHTTLGNKWSAIAKHLPGRTGNEIKNLWNTHLKKKLIKMGIDPMTHQPITLAPTAALSLDNLGAYTSRLQTEAVQAANLQYMHSLLQSAASIAASLNTLATDMRQISCTSPPHMLSPSVLGGLGGVDLAGQGPQNQMPSICFDNTIGNIVPTAANNAESSEQHRSEGAIDNTHRLFRSENSFQTLTDDMVVSDMCNTISTSNYNAVTSQLPSWSEIFFDEELLTNFS